MGRAKQRMIELQGRGFDEVYGNVCENCFEDRGLKEYIKKIAINDTCDFCDMDAANSMVAPLEDVIEHIIRCIRTEWVPLDESGAPWDSEDKGYVTSSTEFDDLLRDLDPGINSEQLFEYIVESVDSWYWARPFASTTENEVLQFLWDRFKQLVTHESRFVLGMLHDDQDYEWHDPYSFPPHAILRLLGDGVLKLSLIKRLPKDTEIFRVRTNIKHSFHDVAELGPPPSEKAIAANRMSPAGISMFYGSVEEETALGETIGNKGDKGIASIATFKLMEELLILDLTSLPPIPSIFEYERLDDRCVLIFIHDFINDLTRPIAQDESVNVEYIPTQIVTEFFRHIFRYNGSKINGIKYPSSRVEGGASYVLFFGPEFCTQDERVPTSSFKPKPLLSLISSKTKHKLF